MKIRRQGVALCTFTIACTLASLLTAVDPAAAAVHSNTAPISIPGDCDEGGIATPYFTDIVVSGETGAVADVNVTLHNLGHSYPTDIDVLLVAPGDGTDNLLVLSDAFFSAPPTDATLTFDDSAATGVSDTWASGSYQPSDGTSYQDYFPPPAPALSSHTTLAAAFNGLDPNGTWRLYVSDGFCLADGGSIAGGWSLDFTTGPSVTIEQAAAQSDPTLVTPINFTADVQRGSHRLRWQRHRLHGQHRGWHARRQRDGRALDLQRRRVGHDDSRFGPRVDTGRWRDRRRLGSECRIDVDRQLCGLPACAIAARCGGRQHELGAAQLVDHRPPRDLVLSGGQASGAAFG